LSVIVTVIYAMSMQILNYLGLPLGLTSTTKVRRKAGCRMFFASVLLILFRWFSSVRV